MTNDVNRIVHIVHSLIGTRYLEHLECRLGIHKILPYFSDRKPIILPIRK